MSKIEFIPKIVLSGKHNNKSIVVDVRYQSNSVEKPVVVFVHGFKGFKDWGYFNLMSEAFAQAGFVFLKLNLSHNGTSPDSPADFVDLEAFSENNFSIELDDLEVVIDYLQTTDCQIPKAEYNHDRIALVGHSRGGGLVILKTAEDPRVKALVTLAAITDLSKRWSEDQLDQWKNEGITYIPNARTGQQMPLKYQLVEDFLNNRDRMDIPKAIQKVNVPFLAFHGTADATLPVQMVETIGKLNKNATVKVLEDGDHTFGAGHPYVHNKLESMVKNIVYDSISFLKESL